MAQELEDEFYTIPEAARALRVSVSTVWRWIDSGKLAAYRVGQRRIRIRRADLAAVVKPFHEGREDRAGKEQIEVFKMSPTEAENQTALIKKAQALQERIMARRGGEPLPSSWPEISQAREERSAQQ